MKEGRTILEVLESFLKVELEDIRRYFGAEVPVHSRKRELVERLAGYIVAKPDEWLGKMLERDLRLLARLVDAGPEVPLYLDYPDYPSVLETIRLLDSDTSDSSCRSVWISKDLYDIVEPHIHSVISRGESSGAFEMERAALGYLSLYGVMKVPDFFDRMLEYWDSTKRQTLPEFSAMLYESPILKLCRFDHAGEQYMGSPNIYDPESILSGRKEFDSVKDMKSFTPEQAIEAGSGAPFFVFGLGTPEGKKLVQMLTNLGYSGEDLVREEHDIWMNAQMCGDDNAAEEIFACVTSKQDEILSFEDYNACMDIVAAYANILPKWLLNGYSANEAKCLKVILQPDEDQLGAMVRRNPLLGLFVPPAAPDSPCPCGSGFSYRLCHGRVLN